MSHLILFAAGVFSLACIVTLLSINDDKDQDKEQLADTDEIDISQLVEYTHYHH